MKILKVVTVVAVVAVVVVSGAVLSTKTDEDKQDETNSETSGLVYGSVVPDENGNYVDDGSSGAATADSSTRGPGGLIEDVTTSTDTGSETPPKKLPKSSKRIGDAVGQDGSILVVTTDHLASDDEFIDVNDCGGVLRSAQEPYELSTESSTEIVKVDNPTITAMCTATYNNYTNGSVLSLGIITLISEDAALDHYTNIQTSFDVNDISYAIETNDTGDWLTGTIDEDQIGEMVILRAESRVITIHNWPSGELSSWSETLLRDMAYSVIERLPTS